MNTDKLNNKKSLGRAKRFAQFLIAFLIAIYSPILLLYALTHHTPDPILLCEWLGRGLVFAIVALGIAVVASKKGKSTSVIIFGLLLLSMNIWMGFGNLAK